MENHPFSFCENRRARKYSNINGDGRPLSRKTLSKYVTLVSKKVRDRIKRLLPDTFGVIFDSWTHEGEHFTCIFATWTNASGGVVYRLLSCGVQDIPDAEDVHDVGFSANDYGDYFYDILTAYGKSYMSLEFLCGDNCGVNKKLADAITSYYKEAGHDRILPLLGCYSHRLNLAVQSLYDKHSEYGDVVHKLNALISEIRGSIKLRLKLLSVYQKQVIKANVTRWNSQHSAIERALEWIPLLQNCGMPREVLQMVPTAAELDLLKELSAILKHCKDVSVFLQHEDPLKCPLHLARATFDALIADYPSLAHHLSKDASIVHNKYFESGVIKLQRGEERQLNRLEKEALSVFKVDVTTTSSFNDDVHPLSSYVDRVIHNQPKAQKSSNYRSVNHVSSTSCICERVFSRGKLVLTDLRGSMDPSTFEDVMILSYNDDLWDVYLVNEAEEEESKMRSDERQPQLLKPPSVEALLVDEADEADEY